MTLTFYTSHHCAMHDMGDEHPECPQRLYAINDQLIASGMDYVIRQAQASEVDMRHVYRVHDKAYVDELIAKAPEDKSILIDDDTVMMPATLKAAKYAAGAGVDAVDDVMQSTGRQAFCSVRPPGHHAEHNKAMGFCFFNNVAVAAAYAMDHYGLQRVAILDFDVHHGNGTEDIFTNDPRVLLCSCFQHPLFPYKGADTKADNILNQPLAAGTGSEEFRQSIEQWLLRLDEFAPQLILISAGFDAHREDPLGQMRLTDADFGWVTEQIKAMADKHCQGRVVSTLEGGYALQALGRSVVCHIKALMG